MGEEEKTETKKSVKDEIKSEVSAIEAIIDDWFSEHFHGIHGLEVTLYNKFYEAKEKLKQKLK